MRNKKAFEERRRHLYHNTRKLLEIYRGARLSLKASVEAHSEAFEEEFEMDTTRYLNELGELGADFSGTNLVSHARSMKRTNEMISRVDSAVKTMRQYVRDGEEYYVILKHAYLNDTEPGRFRDLLPIIQKECELIYDKDSYHYMRKKAINALSTVLWGYDTKDIFDDVESIINPELSKAE